MRPSISASTRRRRFGTRLTSLESRYAHINVCFEEVHRFTCALVRTLASYQSLTCGVHVCTQGLLDSFKDNMASSQTRAYHTAHYVNGTECDITQQPRSARVEVHVYTHHCPL